MSGYCDDCGNTICVCDRRVSRAATDLIAGSALQWRGMYESATNEIDHICDLGNAMRDAINRVAHYVASNGDSEPSYTTMLEAVMLSAVRWDNHQRSDILWGVHAASEVTP